MTIYIWESIKIGTNMLYTEDRRKAGILEKNESGNAYIKSDDERVNKIRVRLKYQHDLTTLKRLLLCH